MILSEGDCLLVVYRRLFESDHSRMFVGNVDAYQDGIVRLTGYTLAREGADGDYCRKAQKQTKIFAIASGTLIIYYLPRAFAIDRARIDVGELKLTFNDGADHSIDISESFRRN